MSDTLNDRNVALQYSKGGYLFDIKTGLVARGACLSWLSFYPEEVCLLKCFIFCYCNLDWVLDKGNSAEQFYANTVWTKAK